MRPANYARLLETERAEAEKKAWVALHRYKFVMFGYWAGVWVHLNRLCPEPQPSPFASLVGVARAKLGLMGELTDEQGSVADDR